MQLDTIFNVVKKCFGELNDPLKFIFDLSLEKRIFPDDLKTARVNPGFKGGGRSNLGNYRQLSVLSCFSKIPERIMYNRFHKYVLENTVLHPKHLLLKLAIQVTTQLFNLTIKYLKLLKITSIRWTCLLTFQKAFERLDHMANGIDHTSYITLF